MTYAYVTIDPIQRFSTFRLDTLGYKIGDTVNASLTGSFSAIANGPDNIRNHFLTYGGTQYTNNLTSLRLTDEGGTSVTIVNNDRTLTDNSDPNGDYGYLLGNPTTVSFSGGTLRFPTNDDWHIVRTGVGSLDASSITTSLRLALAPGGLNSAQALNSYVSVGYGARITDVMSGTGNDVVTTDLNNHTINGNAGDDTIVFRRSFSEVNVLSASGSSAVISGPEGTDHLINFEHFQFNDGTINSSAGHVLINDLYYYSRNLDVYRAHADATTHYNDSGWHEGRDPNSHFSTNGYLAANADVRAAGVNPLQHYAQSGFRDGRDPSAQFDNELYLAHNSDVRASGTNPLTHYLAFGEAEGRTAFAAIGRPADIGASHGFDAEYYLLANSDIARAAITAGGDSFAFALRHFDQFGWHEGRNPNAVFDTNGYIAAYADVAAANTNPLQHYDQFGWKEGRDPSATFDTSTYVSAHSDVAVANIDPMLHYLQNGAVEGRQAFGDGSFGSGMLG